MADLATAPISRALQCTLEYSPPGSMNRDTPRAITVRAAKGHASIGTPTAVLSRSEFQPQCVMNAPVAACTRIATCGTHTLTTNPLSPILSSHPSGIHSISRTQKLGGTKAGMAGTVFTPSIEGMKSVKSENGVILTKPFLEVCKLILPVLDKFGSAMSLVKSDIGGNITRLQTKYDTDSTKYEQLYSMVQVEITAETAKSSSSCTNGLLWLTRAMDFLVELFRNLVEHPDWSMSKCCTDSYSKTLKKWHGWMASSSFTVAMKLAPDRNKFMEIIGGGGDINADIEKFCSSFSSLLEENHKFLASVGMDDLKAS